MSTATFSTTTRRPVHDSATDLCRHLQQCHLAQGRWFGAALLAEQIHGLMAPRFATTVALAAVVLAVVFACL